MARQILVVEDEALIADAIDVSRRMANLWTGGCIAPIRPLVPFHCIITM